MSSKNCPLCGNSIKNTHEQFCSDCQTIKTRYNTSFSSNKPAEKEENSPEENKKSKLPPTSVPINKKRKKKILAIIFAILLTISIGVGTYFLIQYHDESKKMELQYWNKALLINTIESYMSYINRYPNGEYITNAYNNIRHYNENINNIWNSIRKNGSEEEITSFLDRHINTPYHREALNLLDSIAWVDACNLNTQESYKKYLNRIAQKKLIGRYKPLAEEKYNYFARMEFVGGDEWKVVEKQVLQYFKYLSSGSYSNLRLLFAPTVETFYSLENVSPDEIISSIKAKTEKRNTSKVNILPQTDQMKIQKDNKENYIINLTTKKTLLGKGFDKETEETENYRIVLNKDKKIVKLTESKED